MSSPWEIQEPMEARTHYAQCQIVCNEKSGSNGKAYFEMLFYFTPIEPDKEVIERKFLNFQALFQKVIFPSVMKLVAAGKLTSPSDLEAESKFVAFKWTEYKSYDKQDIQYWKNRDPNKLSVDDLGRNYRGQFVPEFLDVFATEEEWRKAAESNGPIRQAAENDPAIEAAKAAIPGLLEVCGTDMARFQTFLQSPPLNVFAVDNPEIKAAVAKKVVLACGSDIHKQDIMLTEINSHFSEPYLELDSPELMAELEEIAF